MRKRKFIYPNKLSNINNYNNKNEDKCIDLKTDLNVMPLETDLSKRHNKNDNNDKL